MLEEKDLPPKKPEDGEANEPVNGYDRIIKAIRPSRLSYMKGAMDDPVESLVNLKGVIGREKCEARSNENPYPRCRDGTDL